MDYPNNRAAAKALGTKFYFTGLPCKHGHIALRKTKGACVECTRLETVAANARRAEYFHAYNRSDAGKETKQRYYAKNKDKVVATAKTRSVADKRRYRAAWKVNHPENVRADVNARRRRYRVASPKWLTSEQKADMRAIHKLAMDMTAHTGVQYVVDHIWPVRHPAVSGLHVPWNLQVMRASENLAKSNNLPKDSEGVAYPENIPGFPFLFFLSSV